MNSLLPLLTGNNNQPHFRFDFKAAIDLATNIQPTKTDTLPEISEKAEEEMHYHPEQGNNLSEDAVGITST